MTGKEIQDTLLALRDEPYGAFQSKLIPTVRCEAIIGVRTPALRKLAKQLSKQADTEDFLRTLPHTFFEEDQLHAFILSEMREFAPCVEAVERFLPFVNNWATCDQMSPKSFGKHREELTEYIRTWLAANEPYTVRFAVKMLMEHFLGDAFDLRYPQAVASLRSEEYYVNMMIAWYFATALAKQYDAVLPFLQTRQLAPWVHNKTIQKALESYRIPPERKEYLRTLKRTGL